MRTVSQNLIVSREFASAVKTLDTCLSFVADWLESQAGAVSMATLEGRVTEHFGQSSSALVNRAKFRPAKVDVVEGIVALHSTDSQNAAEEDRLVTAMRSIDIVERIAQKDNTDRAAKERPRRHLAQAI